MLIPPNQQFEVYVRLRTSDGTEQTNVVYTEPVVSYLKQGGTPVTKNLAVSDWRQLSSTSMPGVYGLTFSAAELDTPGQFLYFVQSIGAVNYVGLLTIDQYTTDVYSRLGAPAGASVSADLAAVKADSGAIKAKTDNLPAAPASTGNVSDAQTAILAAIPAAPDNAGIAAIQALVTVLHKIKVNRRKLHTSGPDAGKWVTYDDDKTTPLFKQITKNAAGVASTVDVYEVDPE